MEEKPDKDIIPIFIRQYPFRFVLPYNHTYRTFCKGRWIGKELLATLIKQFKAYPPEYYEDAIKNGKIRVNDKQVTPEYVLKNGDAIIHVSIRVEPPVLDLPIKIIHESQDFLVICKPPSIIVHTGGGHHYNTVQNILKYEHHYQNLHILHRLDKLTSGLLIFAKKKQTVALFHEESQKQTMKKMYYARIGGNFIWEEKELLAYIECVSHKDGVYRVTQQIEPEELNLQGKQITKLQNNQKKQEGGNIHNNKQQKEKGQKKAEIDLKDSKTVFKKVWYDQKTDSSLLQCYPITGRTHQIRVHLQFLGFPILNDVVYGGRFVGNNIISYVDHPLNQEKEEAQKQQEYEGPPKKKVKMGEQLSPQHWDYQTKPWQIMLHSFKYTFGGRQFKTQTPYWFYKQKLGYKS